MDIPCVSVVATTDVLHKNAVVNLAYQAFIMFNVLLLQRWYNLSDEALESALYDRISVARFAGLAKEDDVPDVTRQNRPVGRA